MAQAAESNVEAYREAVRCPTCNHVIFDGLVIVSRVVRVLSVGAEAKCKICKRWVKVPVCYDAGRT